MRVATRVIGFVLILIGIMEIGDSLELESWARILVLSTGIMSIVTGLLVDLFTRHSTQVKMLERVGFLCLVCGVMQAFSKLVYPFLQGGSAFAFVTLIYITAIVFMLSLHLNYPGEELTKALKKASDRYQSRKKK